MPREMTLAELLRVDRVACWDYEDREDLLGPAGDRGLVTVPTPQLSGLRQGATHNVRCHRKVARMFTRFLELCEQTGRLKYLVSFHGCYNDRTVRGDASTRSTHAWGAAFDFNYRWNMLGHKPAPEGAEGSLLPVVGIAQACGFAWGGHFRRPDGMHFEPWRLVPDDELPVLADARADGLTRAWYQNALHGPLSSCYGAAAVCPDSRIGRSVTAALNGLNTALVEAGVKGDG